MASRRSDISKATVLVVLAVFVIGGIWILRRDRTPVVEGADAAPPVVVADVAASPAIEDATVDASDAAAAADVVEEPAAVAAVDPKCADAVAAAHKAIDDALSNKPACRKQADAEHPTPEEQLAWCTPTQHGAWFLRLDKMTASQPGLPDIDSCLVSAEVHLVHAVDAADGGAAPKSDVVPNGNSPRLPNWSHALQGQFYGKRFEIVTAFDFDGDGEHEIVTRGEANGESREDEWIEIWTAKGGKVIHYPAATPFRIASVEDVDKDGRPDLRTRGPFADVQELACPSVPPRAAMAPIFTATSKPDGTFTMDARATLTIRCASKIEDGDLALRVACARFAGKSEAEAVDGVCKKVYSRTEYCEHIDEANGCGPWLRDVARVTVR